LTEQHQPVKNCLIAKKLKKDKKKPNDDFQCLVWAERISGSISTHTRVGRQK